MMSEGVMRMFFVALLAVVTVVFLVAAAWSAISEATPADEAGPAKEPARPGGPAIPVTLEGALVRQLIDHEISGSQYRRAMRGLAERDAGRHPMTVPPDS